MRSFWLAGDLLEVFYTKGNPSLGLTRVMFLKGFLNQRKGYSAVVLASRRFIRSSYAMGKAAPYSY